MPHLVTQFLFHDEGLIKPGINAEFDAINHDILLQTKELP